jgi:hypothetical protein
MTSERQIAANRRNSQRSSGPRSTAGERRASRNSLRHGLAAIIHRPPAPTADIERLARAICSGLADDPLAFAAAVAIAENHFVRRAIKEQQIAAIKRQRDATALALAKRESHSSGGNIKLLATWLMDQHSSGLAGKHIAKGEPDEFEAVAQAVPDLKRLDRYERGAWSRQKRAIRNFMNIRLMRNLRHAGLCDLESKP